MVLWQFAPLMTNAVVYIRTLCMLTAMQYTSVIVYDGSGGLYTAIVVVKSLITSGRDRHCRKRGLIVYAIKNNYTALH
jgi:hypothetical protein